MGLLPRPTRVFDSNVKQAFGAGAGLRFAPLVRMLQQNPEVVELPMRLRHDAGLHRAISEARVLDVNAWMIWNDRKMWDSPGERVRICHNGKALVKSRSIVVEDEPREQG